MNKDPKSFQTQLNSKTFFIFYTAIVFSVYALPSFKLSIPYLVAALLMLVFLPVAMLKQSSWMNYSVALLFTSILILLFDMLSGLYPITDAINETIRNIRFFLPVLWALYAMKNCNKKECDFFILFFLIFSFIILFKTMSALEEDQWITRILAQSKTFDTASIRKYRLRNIGGFEFSYMMGIFSLCLTWTALKSRTKTIRICCVLILIVCFYYIIQTMYTTLLILTSMGVLLLVLFGIRNQYAKFALVILYAALLFSLAPLLKFLSSVFGDSLLSIKFLQMYLSLTGGGSEALGSRPEYIWEAFQNWLRSPIWGGYAITVEVHSFLFGLLEKNGMIGIFVWGYMYWKSQRLLTMELQKWGINTTLLKIVMLYVLMLAALNPIGYVFEVAIAAFYITPLWLITTDSSLPLKSKLQ